MIGFYDYTVIATYLGLLFALMGIGQAVNGSALNAVLCMGGALLCDTLDGRIARAKKNRTKEQTLFGIQIDSLCDMVSFGVLPAVICYSIGLQDWLGMVMMAYYVLCIVIRLGYYNVMELVKAQGEKTVYRGLPCVGLAVIFPAVYMLKLWLPEEAFLWVLRVVLPLMGTLSILNFKLQKPKIWHLVVLGAVFLVPMAVILLYR